MTLPCTWSISFCPCPQRLSSHDPCLLPGHTISLQYLCHSSIFHPAFRVSWYRLQKGYARSISTCNSKASKTIIQKNTDLLKRPKLAPIIPTKDSIPRWLADPYWKILSPIMTSFGPLSVSNDLAFFSWTLPFGLRSQCKYIDTAGWRAEDLSNPTLLSSPHTLLAILLFLRIFSK